MASTNHWIKAFRLRTLPLSISGILVGTVLAYVDGHYNSLIFFLAILSTVSLQILSNLANDYGDGVKGTDNDSRIGPSRAVQLGLISPAQMKLALVINTIISLLLLSSLIIFSFSISSIYTVIFGLLALISLYASITYTVGNNAYGYKALGDLVVFLFFGILSVNGSYFLYAKHFEWLYLMPSTAIGLLSVGVLNLNNMRDAETDKLSGKITVALLLGPKLSLWYQFFLVIVAMLLILIFALMKGFGFLILLFGLAYFPLFNHLYRISKVDNKINFDPELKVLALCTFFVSFLLAIILLF